ncbi:MAG: hypothetical protein IK059_01725, partial [Firmicutes bacterium]|nr:hypothetical protein [Bacillota bacterium]
MLNFSAVRAVWFSPTGSTKLITEYVAKSLAELLGVPMRSSSYTLPKDRDVAIGCSRSEGNTEDIVMGNKLTDGDDLSAPFGKENAHRPLFLPGELVVWGTPTYAGRIPNKTLDFVSTALTNSDFAGNVMIPIAVYGNRS